MATLALEDFVRRYYSAPVLFVREVLAAEPDDKQRQLMDAVARGERRISVRSGHGVGKTTVLAWLAIWHILTRYPQKTVCTAPTSDQLFDALAAEMKAWILKLPLPLQELLEVKVERIELRSAPNESFIAFRTSRPEKPEALAGVHSEHVLLIADEASGIPEQVFEAAAGSMSGFHATTILAGNPVRTTGLFYATHKELTTWWTLHISCAECSRVDPIFEQELIETYGRGSNAYRVRWLGEFPLSEDDVVIPFEWIEAASRREVSTLLVKPIWGLDVARKGQDWSALAIRVGNSIPAPVEVWQGYDLMETVGRVKRKWDDAYESKRPSEINVDAIGMGAGVADRLLELGLPARSINVSESAALNDRYLNQRTELWFKGRDWFGAKDCVIRDEEKQPLMKELSRTRFGYTSNGKMKVESKDEMKSRGLASPNRADAFLLTLASEAITASGRASRQSWAQPVRRLIRGIV